jgi:branched-chain amino acid transport system ATP-binding protein
MLKVESISASYGAIVALENVSLEVPNGKIVALLGANGAGKSTTLNCISSMVRLKTGRITFNDQLISGLSPDEVVSRGIVQVPEGREIFPDLSISDNLLVGTWLRRKSDSKADFDRVFELFHRIKERLKQDAGTLSGGEQQMLMIGRAIMAKPKILLLDEPSLGLSPVLIESIFEVIQQLNEQGTTILLVEQNTRMALSVCHYAYVLENGEIKLHGSADKLANDPAVREAYLGS